MQKSERIENQELSTDLVRPVAKTTIPQKMLLLANAAKDRLAGVNDRKERLRSNKGTLGTIQMIVLKLQLKV